MRFFLYVVERDKVEFQTFLSTLSSVRNRKHQIVIHVRRLHNDAVLRVASARTQLYLRA